MNAAPAPEIAVRDAATVAILRAAPPGEDGALQVLLLRRASTHVFGPGADVFPGGAIDDCDIRLAARYGLEAADGAARIAAIRECFEESGLLVAARGSVADCDRRSRVRRDLCRQAIGWEQAIQALDLRLVPETLVAFLEWTTPVGAPRRFAARFFAVAAPPDDVSASPDGDEMTAACWITPAAALRDAAAGRRYLMRPTRTCLSKLAAFGSVEAALAGLARSAAERELR